MRSAIIRNGLTPTTAFSYPLGFVMNAWLPVKKFYGCSPFLLGIILQIVFPVSASTQHAERSSDPPDRWITSVVQFPPQFRQPTTQTNLFANLRAEAWAERLKILWTPELPLTNESAVSLHASADELGHWPARDWRPFSMSLRGNSWEVFVPVDDPDVPLVYFVSVIRERASGGGSALVFSTNISPMRICTPRLAGLEEPTRIFWPFLEGFEQDTVSWRWLAPTQESVPLKTDPDAMTGGAALLVALPGGKRSVTIATTRVRGWQLVQQSATGLRVSLRTRQGTGRARMTLLGDASTTNQVVSVWRKEPMVTESWQKVDVLFSDLPRLALSRVDLFAIEFIGEGPLEFLVDDLQLLGPWKLDLE
jgi:hypothetical protein